MHHPPFYILSPKHGNYQTLRPFPKPRYNFYKANYMQINEHLSNLNWNNLLGSLTADEAVEKLYDILYGIIKEHTPLVTAKNTDYPIWFTPSLIRIFKMKQKAWTKWKKYKNISDYETFSRHRSNFKSECHKCFSRYMKSVEDSIKTDINHFWKYIHSRKRKSGLPSTMHYKNVMYNNPLEICNTFSQIFCNVYAPSTLNLSNWEPPDTFAHNNILLPKLHFNETTIKK